VKSSTTYTELLFHSYTYFVFKQVNTKLKDVEEAGNQSSLFYVSEVSTRFEFFVEGFAFIFVLGLF